MADDPTPVAQFDSVEDGQVVRTAAEEVKKYARWSNRIEAAIVLLTAVMVCIGVSLVYRLSDRNKQGVERIIDCTTQGRPCYEEQQQRTNVLIADFLVALNEEHLTIECLLAVPVEQRKDGMEGKCREEAKKDTDAKRKELEAKAKAQADKAVEEEKDGKSGK